jgi:hypothetical protein
MKKQIEKSTEENKNKKIIKETKNINHEYN